jgi:D-alanyl-D-alanine endopeptidase (penicillin-binding protein 7)
MGAVAALFAASPVLTPTAHAAAAAAKKKGKTTAARGHAHSKTHGRAGAKKVVFLERHVAATKGGLPNVQALGALVLDESGHELYSRTPDKERPIASISKLAATLVVMDKGLELEGLSTIAKGDLDVARGGAKSRLLEGMTLSNRDLLHAALMGSDNRAIPALGRAVKLSPSQLAAAMTAKAKTLGLKNTRFHDPTGLSTENVSTPRETIAMLRAVMNHPVLGPITHRLTYDAHPVGKPPITYHNTYTPAVRTNIQVLGGKTGYNDDARYCLVIATKIDGHNYFMSFLSNEGKLTRFGDVARVADWVMVRHPQRGPGAGAGTTATALYVAPTPGAGVTAPAPPAQPSDTVGAGGPLATGVGEPTATGTSTPTATGTGTALPIGVVAPPPVAPVAPAAAPAPAPPAAPPAPETAVR